MAKNNLFIPFCVPNVYLLQSFNLGVVTKWNHKN